MGSISRLSTTSFVSCVPGQEERVVELSNQSANCQFHGASLVKFTAINDQTAGLLCDHINLTAYPPAFAALSTALTVAEAKLFRLGFSSHQNIQRAPPAWHKQHCLTNYPPQQGFAF
mmetsp:Transcript_305/g.653  ORF Transcript_305/g.653 Transcript_305/m.653 type:complete len:117 (-) Transcript_305:4043-4393(-)